MYKIVIVGGGFAGTAAARILSGSEVETHLFDPKPAFDFLPLLPDVLGERYSAGSVSQAYHSMGEKYNFIFHESAVVSIEPETKKVKTESEAFDFDFLIAATGADTNFFGNTEAEVKSFRLRRLSHVQDILNRIGSPQIRRAVVVGGGYTGLEAASQLRRYARRNEKELAIIVVELKDAILSMQVDWMRSYMKKQTEKLKIEIKTECTVDSFEGTGVRLTTGEEIQDCLVVWTAGVKITNPFPKGAVEVDKKGQVIVDEFLRAREGCYVLGDTSRVDKDGTPLPMASYFSVQQGKSAARNILREIRRKPLRSYKPRNYGLVIPLANGRGCGTLIGIKVKGTFAALVHHTASYFRTRNRDTRRSMRRELFRKGMRL